MRIISFYVSKKEKYSCFKSDRPKTGTISGKGIAPSYFFQTFGTWERKEIQKKEHE